MWVVQYLPWHATRGFPRGESSGQEHSLAPELVIEQIAFVPQGVIRQGSKDEFYIIELHQIHH